MLSNKEIAEPEVAKRNVTERVIDYFIENILNGNWKIGEKIPSENTLTKHLGVSRSSIRSAIHQFVGVGAMESVKRKGTYLRDTDFSRNRLLNRHEPHFDVVDMLTLLEFRIVLETDSSYHAAMLASDKNLSNLRRYLIQMKDSIGNPKDFVHYDMLFHEEIIKSTGNILLQNAFSSVMHQKTTSLEGFNESYGYKDGIYYHSLILDAMEKRDPSLTRRLMRTHLQKAIDDIKYEEIIKE
ncbi:FCD domain-containing protein [Marispirochaeta sp.]|jgi:GntR family transcriptional regulator, transcriptional repressor for pyruvate dehydrogenase complex|uniref:FadR/GntR family transcriptional regulator n=1 Tax=Marispirochaeta sp. TaxID=2038653 RepID=UPI0029C6EAFE|nr:FCD domain-containing protein [Marispirochaeta sp.]